MKLKQALKASGVAILMALTALTVSAQDNQPGQPGQPGQGRQGRRGGGPGGGNFDPAQFQQRMMERVREDLGFTNDTDWNAVEPLVQKVMDARRDVGFGGMGMMGRSSRGGRGGQGGGRGGMFGQTSPEQEALQNAIEANAPAAQIKSLLAKYKTAKKEKQAKLAAAQADLRKVLSVKQEAQATLMGLVE
jgi:hypothetical protein